MSSKKIKSVMPQKLKAELKNKKKSSKKPKK